MLSCKGPLADDVTWHKKTVATHPNNDKQKVAVLNGVVLLAKEKVVNQVLVSRMIRKLGATVIVANDGIEVCESERPDVVLMDINMPKRSGIEAVEIIRASGLTMPIYALTAETDKEETDKAIKAGCQGILSKPINRQKMQNTLQQCLAKN